VTAPQTNAPDGAPAAETGAAAAPAPAAAPGLAPTPAPAAAPAPDPLLSRALGSLRARFLFGLGALLAALAHALRIRLPVVLENLARAFPELPEAERRRLARACYASLGRTLAEVALSRSLSDAEFAAWVSIDGLERVTGPLAEGRGVVCALAHFGNWEVLGRAGAVRGVQLSAITRKLKGPWNSWLLRTRSQGGLVELGEKGVSAQAVAILRRPGVLGVLVDQNMRPKRGIFVDFFGVPACTTPAAAVYALRAGATLVAGFPVRQKDGRIVVQVVGPFTLAAGLHGSAATQDLTQQLTRAVEEAVRAAPEQWLWLHRRWKTRPGKR
jgi:KDO2-lipid IV(A) lauroyltransferase